MGSRFPEIGPYRACACTGAVRDPLAKHGRRGCFPPIDDTVRVNFGCGKDVRAGWVNVDGFRDAPGVVRHDITTTPWPFEDGSVDYLDTSHVLEHILPREVPRRSDGAMRDVLFDVIEEAWRVLKPGGTWEIRVPPGNTLACWPHPQHYRNWHEVTFSYWNRNLIDESWLHEAEFEIVRTERRRHPDVARNLPRLYNWKLRGIPVMEHLRIRTRWMERIVPGWWKLFCIVGELRVVLKKPGGA